MCFFSARWREGGRSARHHRRVCGVRGGGRAARALRCGGGRPARRLCFGRTHTICFPGLSDHCVASSDIPARRGLTPRAAVTLRAHPHFQRSPILARRPHPLRSPIPACRRFFPALRRPRPRAAYPCAPRVLPASSFCLRSAGRADIGRDTAPARPRPPRGLTQRAAGSARRVTLRAAARVIRTALSLRAAGFAHPPREGWILAGSQRVPCPPRRPARRPPPGFVRPPRERRILAGSQRVPCPPRRPAPARPRSPCGLPLRAACPARPRLVRSAARVPRVAYPCARPRPPRGLTLPDAGSVCRVALRAHPPLGCAHILPARVSCAAYPCAPPGFVRPRLVRSAARVPRAAYPCAPPASARAASGCIRAMP